MSGSSETPKVLIAVVGILLGGCCVSSALLAVLAPAMTEGLTREGFVRGFAEGMNLPEADERRLAGIAYDEAIATGGLREYGDRDITVLMVEGAARVDDATVLELHRVRAALARSSPVICAGSWTGVIANDDINRALALQSDEVIHRFFRTTFRLAAAGADGGPVVMDEPAALAASDDLWSRAIAARAPSPIADAVNAGNSVSPEQACAAMVDIYTFVENEAEPLRSHDARALYLAMNLVE